MQHIVLLIFILHFLEAEQPYTNALIKENSPYLQQHANNPVYWYPWGKEALNKAKKENKLIFLSIGYSTCHWCHVMEEESFTDEEIAKLLNNDFVSIKVDREEYPQIDKQYQTLYMSVHEERGGWPLSVFMSPDKEVFFIGTYIPKEEGYGSKGLLHLLSSFVSIQKQNRLFARMINKHKKAVRATTLKVRPHTKIMQRVVKEIENQFDKEHGGFAKRPKFPEASKLELLLDIFKLNGNKKAFEMAEFTLKKMAEGGIYDQIGGGFFRYTTDEAWQIPHFEKMLYTNAELISVYVKTYEMTEDKLYRKVVDETIAQMERNYMQEGVYLSASDADSDGEEGGYFIYEY
ncbi:MAG TPA: thioredoxin domain-containing protein, partial [Sulfurovum sp.]|nr:thioredoxin domain-containing protein [Sulfurovum sp.]